MTDLSADKLADLLRRLDGRIVEIYGGHGTVLESPDDDCREAAAVIRALLRPRPAVEVAGLVERLRNVCRNADEGLEDGDAYPAWYEPATEAIAALSAREAPGLAAFQLLLGAAREVETVLKFAIDDEYLDKDTILGLCVDPYGVLHDLRDAIERAASALPTPPCPAGGV